MSVILVSPVAAKQLTIPFELHDLYGQEEIGMRFLAEYPVSSSNSLLADSSSDSPSTSFSPAGISMTYLSSGTRKFLMRTAFWSPVIGKMKITFFRSIYSQVRLTPFLSKNSFSQTVRNFPSNIFLDPPMRNKASSFFNDIHNL